MPSTFMRTPVGSERVEVGPALGILLEDVLREAANGARVGSPSGRRPL